MFVGASASAEWFDRWVPLEGGANFRDVGAYDAGSTQVVRTGLVYRCASLQSATQSDADKIEALGIGLIIDIRSPEEVNAYPDSAFLDSFSTHTYIPMYFAGNWNDPADVYSKTLAARHDEWRQIFEIIADPNNLPLVYHCQAGKDRTGMMTAQLLTLLGVERNWVVHDFLLSQQALGAGAVQAQWIGAVLDDIETSGGIEVYLDAIGVDESERNAIRENLLAPRPTAARHWQLY